MGILPWISRNTTGAVSFSGTYEDRTVNTDYIEFSTGTGANKQVLGGYTETYVAKSGTVLNRKYFGSPALFGVVGFGDMGEGEDSFLPMSQGGGSDIGRPLSTGAINPDYTIEGITFPIFGFLKALRIGTYAAKGGANLVDDAASVISKGDYLRIQNAATKINKPITVVGSRASGTAKAYSDWDYVISGLNSRNWSTIKNSLPGSRSILDNTPRNIDIFKGPLDVTKPHIIINPRLQ